MRNLTGLSAHALNTICALFPSAALCCAGGAAGCKPSALDSHTSNYVDLSVHLTMSTPSSVNVQYSGLLTSRESKAPKAAQMRCQWSVATACRRGEHPRTHLPRLLYPPGALREARGSVRSSSGSAACRAFTAASRGALRTSVNLLAVTHRRSGTALTPPAQGSRQQAGAPSGGASQHPGGPSANGPSLLHAQICRSPPLCRPPTGASSRCCRLPPPRCNPTACKRLAEVAAPARRRAMLGGLCMQVAERPCPPGPPCTAVVPAPVVAPRLRAPLRRRASFRLRGAVRVRCLQQGLRLPPKRCWVHEWRTCVCQAPAVAAAATPCWCCHCRRLCCRCLRLSISCRAPVQGKPST